MTHKLFSSLMIVLIITACAPATPAPPTATSAPPTSTPLPPTATNLPPTLTNTPAPPTATRGIVQSLTGNDGMTLLYVPAGEFTMGSDADDALVECQKFRSDCQRDWFTDEEPPHSVHVDDFWIDQTEVTNKMYALCVEAGVCQEPTSTGSDTHSNYYGNAEFDNYPVIHVDWNMAKTYCEWAGRRLPTEAEWEKAALGLDGRTYPWGEVISCSLANYWGKDGGCVGDTTEVGSSMDGASVYGALDMAGNVSEWVQDWYDAYPGSTVSDPYYGTTHRVLRGGAWDSLDIFVRADRSKYMPAVTDYNLGFRCSRSP